MWSILVGRGALLVLLWAVVYGGADFLTACHTYRVRVHFDFELAIPFWPKFAAIYLSLFPLLWLSPFVLHDELRLRRFATALAWLLAISGIGFVLFPAAPAFATQVTAGHWQPIFDFADTMNLEFNMLPSLHVGMSVLCAAAYSRQARRTATPFFWACFIWTWAVAIILSTLVTHQHHIADVVSGAACGALISRYPNRV